MTCLACHNPHDTPSDNKPAIADVAAVCKDCHNAHLEEGATAGAGTTLRHSVKEMIGGGGTPMATSSVFSLLPQQATGGRLPQCPQEIGTDVRCFLTPAVLS